MSSDTLPVVKMRFFILALIYLSGLAAPVNQFKVPPMMQRLISELDISLAASGWLMSAFALSGFICALPSGALLQKTGVKTLGTVALGCLLAGSLLGCTAGSLLLLIISRVVEGAGMCLFSVVAPSALSAWFPPSERGIPMGVWSTWVPAGNVVIFAAVPFVAGTGWENAWIFSSVYTAAVLCLFILFFKMPPHESRLNEKKKTFSAGGFNLKAAGFLGFIFMAFNILTIAVKSYMPAFLESIHGFSLSGASCIMTIMMISSMVTAPVAGVISDRIRSRRKLVLGAWVLAGLAVLIMFNAPPVLLIVSLALLGIAGGMMPVGIFTAATELGRKAEESGAYMSVVVFGQYAGMFFGPVFFSAAAGFAGWAAASFALTVMAAALFVVSLKLDI